MTVRARSRHFGSMPIRPSFLQENSSDARFFTLITCNIISQSMQLGVACHRCFGLSRQELRQPHRPIRADAAKTAERISLSSSEEEASLPSSMHEHATDHMHPSSSVKAGRRSRGRWLNISDKEAAPHAAVTEEPGVSVDPSQQQRERMPVRSAPRHATPAFESAAIALEPPDEPLHLPQRVHQDEPTSSITASLRSSDPNGLSSSGRSTASAVTVPTDRGLRRIRVPSASPLGPLAISAGPALDALLAAASDIGQLHTLVWRHLDSMPPPGGSRLSAHGPRGDRSDASVGQPVRTGEESRLIHSAEMGDTVEAEVIHARSVYVAFCRLTTLVGGYLRRSPSSLPSSSPPILALVGGGDGRDHGAVAAGALLADLLRLSLPHLQRGRYNIKAVTTMLRWAGRSI